MAKGDPRTGGAGYFPAIYQSALSQSAEDYDSIMNQYKNLGRDVKDSNSYSPVRFEQNRDFGGLEDFTKTGGYSDEDISNIRERSISPIRSIYDSASRNLNRQKNIQGGYSPNFGAVQAKLARDMSSAIGERTTAANANIAQMVQQGKLAGSTALAPIKARENEFKNQFVQSEAARKQQSKDTDYNKILETIRGQQSTYGTTPALASTFGNQVLNAANTVSNFPPVTRGSGTGMATGVPNPNVWNANVPSLGANRVRRRGVLG